MRFRVRTWDGPQPLPGLDVTTGSIRTMVGLVQERADSWGWDNVSLMEPGERPIKGDELRRYVERVTAAAGWGS